MITVSATVRGLLQIPHAGVERHPADRLRLDCGGIGDRRALSIAAVKGYRVVAAFANLVAPLMVVMFVVFGVIGFARWA